MTSDLRNGDDDHAPELVLYQREDALGKHGTGVRVYAVVKNKDTLELVGVVTERDVVKRSGAVDV